MKRSKIYELLHLDQYRPKPDRDVFVAAVYWTLLLLVLLAHCSSEGIP